MIVELTWAELEFATWIAERRNGQARAQGHRPRHGQRVEDTAAADRGNACAELAVAKLLDLYFVWKGRPDKDGDVGPYFVRSTPHPKGGLILYKDDAPDRIHILVRGTAPRLEVVGWTFGYLAQEPRWWNTNMRSPCFLLPAIQLGPIDDLLAAERRG